MKTLREEHEAWLKQFHEERKTKFNCPKCDATIGTLKPTSRKPFTSAGRCPDCNALFFKTVYESGKVMVTSLGTGARG